MCAADMLEAFDNKNQELREAIRRNDTDEIRRLDSEISDLFEKIISADVPDYDGKKAYVGFLLNLLVAEEDRQELERRICDRLIDLA